MPAASTKKYELLLIAVIAARATSFIFSKMILESLTPFNLLAVRFIIAFILLALIFNKTVRSLTRRDWLAGLAIGTAFFITMACEMIALTQAASSLVSLLENCAIIFVPLFELLLFKKFPAKITVISTGLAMLGVVLLALSQGGLSGGFSWGLLAGMCYAGAIIITQRLSQNSSETLGIGIVQIGTMGVLSLLSVLALEQPQLPQTGAQWLMLALLIIVCTGFGFTLQPMAQSHVTAARAGLFCAVSPAIATLLGVTVLDEPFGMLDVLGLFFILASIALPYINTNSTVTSKIKVTLNCDIKTVWNTVTDIKNYNWRSDLSHTEILENNDFVEYTKNGYSTTFTTTIFEPYHIWKFNIHSNNISGHWTGIFESKDNLTELEFTETITVNKFYLKPFLKFYLNKQQKLFINDLKKVLNIK